jgi:hypothetical protein
MKEGAAMMKVGGAAVKNFQKFFFSSTSVDLSVIKAFGKNEQVKRVFLIVFIAMAGLVLAWVVDPVTDQQVVGIIMGMGV